jgi:hypothetical protein
LTEKLIYTSGYGQLRKVPGFLVRVVISRGLPPHLQDAPGIQVERRLCPTWPMLKMPRSQYDEAFDAVLKKLDPARIYASLPSQCVLLCFEAPNVWCHRRRVAEWLEKATGCTIPEYGLARAESIPYRQLPEVKPKRKPDRQLGLF